MNRLPPLAESISSPCALPRSCSAKARARLGLTICPRKRICHVGGDRDLEKICAPSATGAPARSLPSSSRTEFELLKVCFSGAGFRSFGMRWIHLPIRDVDIPDQRFAMEWRTAGPENHERNPCGREYSHPLQRWDWPDPDWWAGLDSCRTRLRARVTLFDRYGLRGPVRSGDRCTGTYVLKVKARPPEASTVEPQQRPQILFNAVFQPAPTRIATEAAFWGSRWR